MVILQKLIYTFIALLIKISATFLAEIDKLILKFLWKGKGIRKWRTKLEGTLSYLKTYSKATVLKIVCYCHKYRQTDQWNRTESPEINPYQFMVSWFSKRVASQFNGERIVSSVNVLKQQDIPCKLIHLDQLTEQLTKIERLIHTHLHTRK